MMKIFLATLSTLFILTSLCNAEIARDLLDEKTLVNDSQISQTDDNIIRESINLKSIQKAYLESNNESSILNIRYNKKQEIKLRLRVNTNTTINLPMNDEIETFVLGDTESFNGHVLPKKKNIFIIKALDAGVDTSLHLITKSGETFVFYLFSTEVNYQKKPDLMVYINSEYNNDLNSSGNKLNPSYTNERKGLSNERYDFVELMPNSEEINTNYEIRGNKDISPYAVADDGEWTYFDFRINLKSGRLPSVYNVINRYEAPQDSNSVFKNGIMIVKSVSSEPWVLRYDNQVVCIKKYQKKKD